MIKQTKSGKYQVVHCHGKDKGKPISKPMSYKKALAQHRAIESSKKK
jgi:hypothetical protein